MAMVGSQTYINEVVVVQSDITLWTNGQKIFKQPNCIFITEELTAIFRTSKCLGVCE